VTVAQASVYGLGFLGQALFASRILLQWIASERAKRSVVPRSFFGLSLLGSACSLAYAAIRKNPVFMLSQLPQTFIYARNLLLRRPSGRGRLLPIAAALAAFSVWTALADPRPARALWPWPVLGMTGAVLWSARFVVQWWVSERRGVPTLPAAFWILSLLGSLLLLAYAVVKRDPVWIVAYALGPVPYARNLVLLRARSRVAGRATGSAAKS
jgi:lipid-A-disaccharide synthase-like uncharacterized protein